MPASGGMLFVSFLLTGPLQASEARCLAPWGSLSSVSTPHPGAAPDLPAPLMPTAGAGLEVLTWVLPGRGGRADPSRCHMPSTGLQRSRSACIRSCVPVLLLTQSDPGVVPQFHLLIRALGGRNCSIIQSWRLVQNGHQGPVLLGGQHESPGRVIPRGPWGCL